MLPISTVLLLSAVVGLLGLDSTGALQVMLSRPLVVGGVVGFLLGDTAAGLTLGSLVELLCMAGLPVGSLVPPDGTAAAAMAAAAGVCLARVGKGEAAGHTAASALAVLAAVPAGVLGARAEVAQRILTNRLSRHADAALAAGRLPHLGGILAAALGLAWLRGTLVCALCLGVGLPILGSILARMPPEGVHALHWSFWLFWLLGMAVAADQFWDRRGIKHAAGAALLMAVFGTQFGASQQAVLAMVVGLACAAGIWRWMGARRGELA